MKNIFAFLFRQEQDRQFMQQTNEFTMDLLNKSNENLEREMQNQQQQQLMQQQHDMNHQMNNMNNFPF